METIKVGELRERVRTGLGNSATSAGIDAMTALVVCWVRHRKADETERKLVSALEDYEAVRESDDEVVRRQAAILQTKLTGNRGGISESEIKSVRALVSKFETFDNDLKHEAAILQFSVENARGANFLIPQQLVSTSAQSVRGGTRLGNEDVSPAPSIESFQDPGLAVTDAPPQVPIENNLRAHITEAAEAEQAKGALSLATGVLAAPAGRGRKPTATVFFQVFGTSICQVQVRKKAKSNDAGKLATTTDAIARLEMLIGHLNLQVTAPTSSDVSRGRRVVEQSANRAGAEIHVDKIAVNMSPEAVVRAYQALYQKMSKEEVLLPTYVGLSSPPPPGTP